MKIKLILIAILVTPLISCAGKQVYFKHDIHGKVSTKSEIYESERAICDKSVYGDGVDFDGVILTNISDTSKHIAEHMVKQYKTGKPPEQWEEQPHRAEIDALVQKSNECLRNRGWLKVDNKH